jgi:hypothetical protein
MHKSRFRNAKSAGKLNKPSLERISAFRHSLGQPQPLPYHRLEPHHWTTKRESFDKKSFSKELLH